MRIWLRLAAAAVGLLALGAAAFAVQQAAATVAFRLAALEAEGTVVRVTRHSGKGTNYRAVLAYTDAEGQRREGVTHLHSADYDFAEGTVMPLRYDPAEPGVVRVGGWAGDVLVPGLSLGLAGMLAAIAAGLLSIAREGAARGGQDGDLRRQ